MAEVTEQRLRELEKWFSDGRGWRYGAQNYSADVLEIIKELRIYRKAIPRKDNNT